MFLNNLLSILRGFLKQKTTVLINLVGLTLGITVSIILLMLVKYENSYDKFHKNTPNLYRILAKIESEEDQKIRYINRLPSGLPENVRTSFPELKERISGYWTSANVKVGKEKFSETIIYADKYFLKIYSFPLVKGNIEDALAEPMTVILTETLARKIFGTEDVLNKTVKIGEKEFKVTGIAEDTPHNSTLQFGALISITSSQTFNSLITNWNNIFLEAGISLPKGEDKGVFEKKLNQMAKSNNVKFSFILQPLSRVHLYSDSDYGVVSGGNITNLYIYSFFVFFILLTAAINYTNISFIQINKKMNEIGMRKILGATGRQLFFRNWLEAFLVCFISFIISIQAVRLIMPDLNNIIKRNIEFSFIISNSLEIILLLFIVTIVLGLLPTLKLLKLGKSWTLKKDLVLRDSDKHIKGMLALQFAISLFFLISAMLISKQIGFISDQFNIKDDEDIIMVNNQKNSDDIGQSKLFYNAIQKSNKIKSSSYSGAFNAKGAFHVAECEVNMKKDFCYFEKISDGYLNLYNLKLKEGRNFDLQHFQSDADNAVIVNEAFLREFNIKDYTQATVKAEGKEYSIIGVVKDFSFTSLKNKITPFYFVPVTEITMFNFQVKKSDIKTVLSLITVEWNKYFPGSVLSYSFFNESTMEDYNDELVSYRLFSAFSSISMFLSILGIIGLTSLMIIRRKKEVAIRQVLGATNGNIIIQFSKEYLMVVVLGFILAAAAGYYYINKFLEDFAYRIKIDIYPFLFSLGIILVLVVAVIFFQSVKLLKSNPANSLKIE